MKMIQIVRNFALVLFFIFLSIAPSSAFSIRNMTLNFAQISDTHISDSEDTSYKVLSSSKELLKDAVTTLNNTAGIDFVMFTGDMVDIPLSDSYRDFFTVVSGLNYPSLVTFGAHDSAVCIPGSDECSQGLDIDEALDFIKKCNRNYVFDKTYYAFTPKTDYRIVVLDATIRNEVTTNGYIDDEQLRFLDNELAQNQDKVVVIFSHYPIIEPFKSEDHSIKNADSVVAILKKYKNPILVCSGHYHATKIVRDKNLIFVDTPSLVTYPNAFRVVKITNYKDRTEFKFVFYETNLKDVQQRAKTSTIAATSFYGTPKDRDVSFILKKKYVKIKKEKKPKEVKPKKQKKNKTKKDVNVPESETMDSFEEAMEYEQQI